MNERSSLISVRKYFADQAQSILALAQDEAHRNPLVLFSIGGLISSLSNMAFLAEGKGDDGRDYLLSTRPIPPVNYIEEFFPERYREFKYQEEGKTLPQELINALEGLAFNFSFAPPEGDGEEKKRKVVVDHVSLHLERLDGDRAVINVGELAKDLLMSVHFLFDEAIKDKQLAASILIHQSKWPHLKAL